jgi:hypothetical protein
VQEHPPVDGKLVPAVAAMYAGWHEEGPYTRPYYQIAQAFLDIPAVGWGMGTHDRWMREFDWVYSKTALRWIGRVRARNLLASILLTDVLDRLTDYACALGSDRRHAFPSPQRKKQLTVEQGQYFIEFEVPPGAAFRYHYEERAEYGPGFRGVALIERCHLSSNVYQTCNGEGVIPGFGPCRTLLGFDIPCDFVRHARFDGDAVVPEGGGKPFRIGCRVPFGFVVNSRTYHFGLNEIGPAVPKLGLDAMVDLIREAAAEEN